MVDTALIQRQTPCRLSTIQKYLTNLGDGVQGPVAIVIATEGPRIAPSRPTMRARLAELCRSK